MKKVFIMFFMFFCMFFSYNNAEALSWYIECINYSCKATAGGLAVLWSGDVNGGELTGVNLPVSLEQMNEISKVASQTVERVLSNSLST